MTLRQEYNKLEQKILDKYKNLVDVGSYNTLEVIIKENYNSISNEVLSLIEEVGIGEANKEYDFLEGIEQIYYNNKKGEEKMAVLLGANKKKGLYVFDNELYKTIYIGFSNLNSTFDKISVIEQIQES